MIEKLDLPTLEKRWPDGRRAWYTLVACPACHGICGIYPVLDSAGKTISKERAFLYALFQFGHLVAGRDASDQNWVNIEPEPCNCACDHQWSRRTIRMFEHEDSCSKCGISVIVDSSG